MSMICSDHVAFALSLYPFGTLACDETGHWIVKRRGHCRSRSPSLPRAENYPAGRPDLDDTPGLIATDDIAAVVRAVIGRST
jgi:hypothetical protein